MKKPILPALCILLVSVMLQGCAAALVGGTAATVGAAHDRRTFGIYIEDQSIEFKAAEKFANDPEITITGDPETEINSHINVTSYNLVVLLTGQTANQALKTRAEQLVANIERVRQVVNEIEIGNNATLKELTRSSALTAEVKFKLTQIDIPNFDTLRVKVVTDRSVVYLMGILTRTEADKVTELVRNISGIRRVVKVFEYIEETSEPEELKHS